MPKVTYDLVESNIADLDVQGNQVRVTWKCPVTGKVVGESGATMRASSSTAKAIQQSVARVVIAETIGAVVRAVSQSLGGISGKIAQSAAMPAQGGALNAVTAPRYTEASRQQAVVEAFGTVESRFRWDEDRGMYVAA